MRPGIFFITGTSGAGKTTLVKNLPSTVTVYDMDDGGVPEGADNNWRQERTNKLLADAKNNLAEGKSTVICGVSVPKEVQHAPVYNSSLPVHYGYISIGKPEIRKRLESRGWEKRLIDDNITWAEHLEQYVRAERHHYVVNGENEPKQVAAQVKRWITKETK